MGKRKSDGKNSKYCNNFRGKGGQQGPTKGNQLGLPPSLELPGGSLTTEVIKNLVKLGIFVVG